MKLFKFLYLIYRRYTKKMDDKPVNNYTTIPDVPVNPTTNRVEPGQVASGLSRGTQYVGSDTLQIDSGNNLITIKEAGTTSTTSDILRVGQVSTGYLGMAVSNAGYDTMFAGQDVAGHTVIKIAKAGYDAKTAADSQLIFNSSQNVFKIVNTLTADFSLVSGGVNPASTTVTIFHNLGYVPLTESTVTITTLTNGTPGIYPVPFFTPGTGGGTTNVFILLSYFRVRGVTTSSITYELGIQAPSQTFNGTVTCYIKQESAT